MASKTLGFHFGGPPIAVRPVVVAELPAGITSKGALLDELQRRLAFPDYFGFNWDALEECIRDLSWLPPGPVVLKHRDFPLGGDDDSRKIYLSILRDAAEKRWAVPGQVLRDLLVCFPADTKNLVVGLLRMVDDEEARREGIHPEV